MRAIGLATLVLMIPMVPGAHAQTAPPPAATPAPTRGKQLESWAHANRAALQAAVTPGDPLRSAARVRLAATALGALADSEICDVLVAAADSFIGDGENDTTLLLGQAALDWARLTKLDPGYLYDALARTGSARYFMSDFAGAARDLAASVEQARAIAPFDANAVANATANYAVILDAGGHYREAIAAFQAAIALRRGTTPIRYEGMGVAYSSMAATYKRMGRWDLADANYRTALSVMEDAGLTARRQYNRALHNYAVFVSDSGRDEEAVALYRRVFALIPADKHLADNMVPDYTTLSVALARLGRLDEADVAITTAIGIVEKQSPPTVDAGFAYADRASLRIARGDLAGAEADQRQALAVDRLVYKGDRNLQVPADLLALSAVLRRRGKIAEADRVSAQAAALIDVIPELNPLRAVILDERAAALAAGDRRTAALVASRSASELLARRFDLDQERDPGPIPEEQRPIMGRRVALAWDAAHR